MEQGQFSLMRSVYRNLSTHRNNAGTTANLSFQDASSYIQRQKAIALGMSNPQKKKAFQSQLAQQSLRRLRGAQFVHKPLKPLRAP
jgi:hypothetical protein